MSIT
ncbi:hypothetical protein B4U79_05574 [Dinothrombium tinctorium]|jgi:putative transposase